MRRQERTAIKIARIFVRIVAAFQLLAAAAGVIAVGSAVQEHSPFVAVTVVYVLFATTNLITGMMLVWLQEWGVLSSMVLQLLQIPVLATESFPYYPLGICLPITHHSIAHDGIEAHLIGVNLIAAVLFGVLLRFGNRATTTIPTYIQPLVMLPKRVAPQVQGTEESSDSDTLDTLDTPRTDQGLS